MSAAAACRRAGLALAAVLAAAGHAAGQPAAAPGAVEAAQRAALAELAAGAASPFFTDLEVELAEALLEGARADEATRLLTGDPAPPPPPPAPPRPNVHLGALIYFSPERWVLWLNGERRTPDNNDGGFRVVAVGRDQARIAWTGSDGSQPYTVTLKPQQTYIAGTGSLREGRGSATN
jgi:hypothetical protein